MSESFNLLAGDGNPSFSFGPQGAQPGAWVDGTVLEMANVQQRNFDTKEPEVWDNGDPKMQIRLTLQTTLRDPAIPTDTGIRDVYLRGKKKPHDNGAKSTICAVLDAVRAATGGTELQRGGRVILQWISGMGFSGDPRNYQAQYAPPALDLVGGAAPQLAQQPAQAAPVAAVAQAPLQVAQPPAWAAPAQAAPVQQMAPPATITQPAAPVQAPVQPPVQLVPSEQGPVNPRTGEIAPALAATPTGPTPEAVAAVRAAGQDPAAIWPGFNG